MFNTCCASSLVGSTIIAWLISFFKSLVNNGSKNAKVLPVPVWAEPIISLPVIAIGIDFSWISVGVFIFKKNKLFINSKYSKSA